MLLDVYSDVELRAALELQRRTYALLLWLNGGVAAGFITLSSAHRYTTLPDAAREWIVRHYLDLPLNTRPAREDVERFANLFATYLQTSFELDANPGSRRYSPHCHCYCPWCSWLVELPHLKPKKPTGVDRRKADALVTDALQALAAEDAVSLSNSEARKIAHDPAFREDLARIAWAQALMRRLAGQSDGPAVLVLWRIFAWTRSGSPIKNYEPTAEEFIASANSLRDLLAATLSAHG